MITKEELIERILNYDKEFNEKTKKNKKNVICTNTEIAKLFRQKLEENNNLLK